MTKKLLKVSIYFLVLVLLPFALLAKGGDGKNQIKKTLGAPSYTKFNINNVSTFIYNNGSSDITPSGDSGFLFPKSKNKAPFFQSGFLWGGKVNDDIRVGGSVYRQGTRPGRIVNGVAAPEGDLDNRIYRVRRDIPGDVTKAAKYYSMVKWEKKDEGAATLAEVVDQYQKDWNEWPVSQGAPFEDVDKDGKYDALVDVPGVPGADQTVWFVNNDLDPGTTDFMYGSLPLGIEQQVTIWGYNKAGDLGNMLFRKFKIINKSLTKSTFTDFYVSMWSDPDNGDAGDDFAGCDTTTSLFYIYNAKASDAVYASNPPAAGFDFFQGPKVKGTAQDTALANGKKWPGFKNLPMTAFYYFAQGATADYSDPTQGQKAGALQFYNLFQGKVGRTGQPFPIPTQVQVPNGPKTTNFPLSGDPVTGKGYLDGIINPASDRRMGAASGPFTIAYGDTQEVVVAELAAGAIPGISNIGAVSKLKSADVTAQKLFNQGFPKPTPFENPDVKVLALDSKIVLNWGHNLAKVNATENYKDEYYKFQGYNVYQLVSEGASVDDPSTVRIATFDIIDGVTGILGKDYDPVNGAEISKVLYYGSDSGIERYLTLDKDWMKNTRLNNGTKYYYAIAPYAYTDTTYVDPRAIEAPLDIYTVIPQVSDPGTIYNTTTGTSIVATHKAGTASGSVEAVVVDPLKVNGHDYEVSFKEKYYYLATDGKWKTTNFPDKIGKAGDVVGSTVAGVAVYALTGGTVDLNFILNIVSSKGSWVDGIKLTFPTSVKINNAPTFTALNNDPAGYGVIVPKITGNVIDFGKVTGAMTENGAFEGGESFKVNINTPTLPLTITYTIYDDTYGNTGVLKNATGTITITAINNKFVTQKQWNLKDVTTGNIVLADQTVVNGTDVGYSTPENGPGGSRGYLAGSSSVGSNSQPIVDGLQVSVTSGSYAAPINYQSATITQGPGTATVFSSATAAANAGISIVNYTVFGGTITSKAYDNYGGIGTLEIDQLQQDYELRWTGVQETQTIGGKTVIVTKSGGQMASVFALSSGTGFNLRPDFPAGQANGPYMVRIPFEVWNVTDPAKPRQVNLMFRDRIQTATSSPFYSWNINDRMYAVVVNSDYNATKVLTNVPGPDNALATWVWVFYSTKAKLGDKLNINYANPLQMGKDVFTFKAPIAATYSADKAKDDVENINVFPNPYYGVNSQEINKYQRFVTFNHLPGKATIRIFNLAGQLIKEIAKDDATTQFQRWDLANQDGLPAASGMYVAHIDMPDLGKVKILKLIIIQEQQILDKF